MNWQGGLEQLAIIAKKADIEWWTTGKILLPLNGIDAEIDDVDFYFHKNDLEAVRDAFQGYVVEPITYKGSRYNALFSTISKLCLPIKAVNYTVVLAAGN